MVDDVVVDKVDESTVPVMVRLYLGRPCRCGNGTLSELPREGVGELRNRSKRYGCTAGCHRRFSLQSPSGLMGRVYPAYQQIEWRGRAVRCGWKHDWAWLGRRVGRRVDLFCRALVGEGRALVVCGGRRTVYLGEPHGFTSAPRAEEVNMTKSWVLSAFADYDWHTARSVSGVLPHLTRGQVLGCVSRLAKGGFVEKSFELVYEPPSGRAWAYRLASKGEVWLSWAKQVGLIGDGESNG